MARSERLIQLVCRATLSNSFAVMHYALFGFMSQNHNKIRPVSPNAFYCSILMREIFNLHFVSSHCRSLVEVKAASSDIFRHHYCYGGDKDDGDNAVMMIIIIIKVIIMTIIILNIIIIIKRNI